MSKKLIALIFYFFIHTAFAQSIPPLINYQGMLTDSEGKPLANTKKLTFNIYASAGATDPIWGPQVFTIVPLINGQFNVILGTTDTAGRSLATAFSGSSRYLGIKVGNEAEITPRQQILSTPYAMQAENSVSAQRAGTATKADNGVSIGTILAWHKNLPNTPSLSYGWVECNGQVLNDSESPYNGHTLPNLNGEGRFLRGSPTSGTHQPYDWKSFTLVSEYLGEYTHGPIYVSKSGMWEGTGIYAGSWGASGSNRLRIGFDGSEIRPINMSVVWIIKVK